MFQNNSPRRSVDVLKRDGFTQVGEMVLAGGGLRLQGELPRAPGVYAFVIDGRLVAYVGQSTNVRHRVWGYGYDFDTSYSKQHRPVRVNMRELLEAGAKITVWLCANVAFTLASGRTISMHEGLEASLIDELRPAWNVLHVKPRSEWRGGAEVLSASANKAWATRRARAVA